MARIAPGVNFPPILPEKPFLFAFIHDAHNVMSWAFCLIIIVHLSATLLHAYVYRDGLFSRITWTRNRNEHTENILPDDQYNNNNNVENEEYLE